MKSLVACMALVCALFFGTSNANAHCPVVRNVAVGVVKAPVVVVRGTVVRTVGVLRGGRQVVHNVLVHRRPVRRVLGRVFLGL